MRTIRIIGNIRNNHLSATIIFIVSILIGTSALANDESQQLAAVDNTQSIAPMNKNKNVDNETGSTDTSDFDSRLGAYSREDGSMDGAYGDGEYGD
jgi:hypothetical protein